ncbi:hypothetical protein KFL_001580120 [Klebsormidium nitens]|uniref:Uncharacterized protein n=1 Tax=Klebsormidium nitens TaxID=105231 RepID=A0A1Y1I6H1_KLENI|nr:hypothetical protein KFL_001580120 [Klebsormidium nitens]|eukprot:GAQ83698.1 hypothetical protein KFL_001580120 [Klebsormidium nitens]
MALSARAGVGVPICAFEKASSQLASSRHTTRSIKRAALCFESSSLSHQIRPRQNLSCLGPLVNVQPRHCTTSPASVPTSGLSSILRLSPPQSKLPSGRRVVRIGGPPGRRTPSSVVAQAGAVPDGQAHGIANADVNGSFPEAASQVSGANFQSRFTEEESSHVSGNGFFNESPGFSEVESPHFIDGESQAAGVSENGDGMGVPGRARFSNEVVEVSVLDDSPGGRSREEMARELASVGIELPSYSSDGPKRAPDASRASDSNAEKLAAIMAKNGLDPSEFAEQYEEALAKQRDERSRKGGRDLLEQYGAIAARGGDWQEEGGVRNRASVAWDGAMERGSRFTAEHGLSWPIVVFWSTVLCAAVAAAVWFRSFVWQKWEKQKLEREREGRIMRLNKLKHMGRLEEVTQASKTSPAVVSLTEVREQILASQEVPVRGQNWGTEDEREMRVFGDEDDVALLAGEEKEEVGWVGGLMRKLGLKKEKLAVPAISAAAAATPVLDSKAQEDLRREWERVLEAEKRREAGRFYEVTKPIEDEDEAENIASRAAEGFSSIGSAKAGLPRAEESAESHESVSFVNGDASNGRTKSFSTLPGLQDSQRSIEARVAEMTSPKEKAEILAALRGFSAEVARSPPGTVDEGAFRAWWDAMASEIANRSVVKENVESVSGSTTPQEREEVSAAAENGRLREGLDERGTASGGVNMLEEPCVSAGGYQDAEWTGTFPSTSGRTAAEASATVPGGSPSLAAQAPTEDPVRDWAEPEVVGENGRNLENGAQNEDASANGRAVTSGAAGAKPKVKVTRIVRKRKKVKAPEPAPAVEDGPDTITGEHPIFGAQYKDGTTEFARRVQRDFEAELAADPELRRIRAEVVLNGQEGRSDWDGLESWEKKLYHACEEKHFKRLQAKVRSYLKKEAKARGVDYDKLVGEGDDKPRWLTDSIEDQVAAEGDPLVQEDMMRDIMDQRLGRKPGMGTRFGPKGIPQEDLEAMAQEERRRREERQTGPAPQAVESSSGVLFPDESIPPEQFSSTLQWAETIKEKEAEAEVSELSKEVSELSDFSETRRWAEELAARDVITEEEILQAHVDAHTVLIPKPRLRRKRRVGDPVTPEEFERTKAKARGSEMMQEWDMEDFAREYGVDADAPDDFDPAEYEAAGERVRARVRQMLPNIKEMKKAADHMGPNEFLAKHGKELGLDVRVPEPRPRMSDGDKRWWTHLPEVQVILLNKSGKYQLLALDLTAEVTGNCYVIGFQDKKEAAWFQDWLSKVPHHATHQPVVQPIGPTELEEYAARTSSQILVVKRGYARFRPGMTTDQMEFELMGLAEDSTVTEFMEKLLPELEEMQKKQVDNFFSGDPELVKMMQEAVGAGK